MNVSVADANKFLVKVARAANYNVHNRIEAESLFDAPSGVPTGLYQLSMAKCLESDKLLKVHYDETNQRRLLVTLTPNGLMQARRFDEPRRTPTVVERLVSDRSQKLINVGNFLVALSALLVAAIALLRTS